MDDVIDAAHWARLDDYFADRLSLAERIEMDRWAAEREDRRRLVADLRDLWRRAEAASPDIGPVDIRGVLNTLAARREAIDVMQSIASPVSVLAVRRRSNPNIDIRKRWQPTRVWSGVLLATAAAIVVAIALDWQIESRQADRPAESLRAGPREFSTRSAQRAELRLSDGTRVLLAPDSKLTVPAQYDSVERTVALQGQAYFDVVHNDAKPFRVRARHALVHDLGTRFDVRAFANETAVRVVVTEGKVSVGDNRSDPALLLHAGDVARLREDREPAIARGLDTADYVAWTHGKLVFEQTPVNVALAELSRWYDLDIQIVDSSLYSRRVTATLDNDKTVSEVLSLIESSLNARVDRQQRTVTIRAN